MTDAGYWARLGLQAVEEGRNSHPLGFHYGTIEGGVVPRLAVLLAELSTQAQIDAFKAVVMELGRYCQQTNSVVEDLREMARDLKNLEDDIEYGASDLQQLRNSWRKYPDSHRRFDPETYKRSSVVNKDLSMLHLRVDWGVQAVIGRRLDHQLAEAAARKEKESAERYAALVAERKARHEAGVIERLGVLYKTSPKGIDDSIPKNVRDDIPGIEKQLTGVGFALEVDGHAHCCTMSWADFIVYADPRSDSSLRFNVYKGDECMHTFWLKDKLGNLKRKVEAQLSKLQEQDRATVGFLDRQRVADTLGVSTYAIDHLIGRGLPMSRVGSVQRFDPEKVLAWARSQPKAESVR